jgi:hypothetical protein
MNKTIFVILIFLISTLAFPQSKSDIAGVWKATVKAGDKLTNPTYVMLNSDGTYSWGVDADGAVSDKATKGTWDLTGENEIKIMPEGGSADISYYVKKGNQYRYEYVEEKGVKTRAFVSDMDWYLEKVK